MIPAVAATAVAARAMRLIDIGANLLDARYLKGRYDGHKQRSHAPDLDAVLKRAEAHHVTHIIVTAGELREARAALALCRRVNASGSTSIKLHCTVGVHPTRTSQLDAGTGGGSGGDAAAAADESSGPEGAGLREALTKAEYIHALEGVIEDGVRDGTVVAVGECGLDYDRLHHSPKDAQLRHFGFHFDLAERFRLPMFLHDRNTGGIVSEQRHRFPGGVVHSFTGTAAELHAYVALGLHIGINGCSLKTAENVAVAAAVPLDRLLLETDAPWCEIRRSHASHTWVRTAFPAVAKEKYDAATAAAAASAPVLVKGRSEPCQMIQVAEAVAGARGEADVAPLVAAVYDNTAALFFPVPATAAPGQALAAPSP